MNLYLVSQAENDGYDTYDAFVVAAADEQSARETHPFGGGWEHAACTWASSPDNVEVTLIGAAAEGVPAGVVLASYNAG